MYGSIAKAYLKKKNLYRSEIKMHLALRHLKNGYIYYYNTYYTVHLYMHNTYVGNVHNWIE